MQIETERLLMRPIVDYDADDVLEYCSEPNVGPNAGWKPHENIEETRDIMNKLMVGKENVFGIVLKGIDKMIGSITLNLDLRRKVPNVLMLGYVMSEHYWGKGLMTEAAKSVIKYGFEELSLNMITCTCFTDNSRSRRVIQKCGFKYEGTLRSCEVRYDGAIKDMEFYSLTKEEWNLKNNHYLFHNL